MRLTRSVSALVLCAMTAACATSGANYVPVVDGPVSANFQADLAACQQLAAQQGALSSGTGGQALAGAALGAGGTAIINNSGNNVRDAAAIGAAAGLVGGALQQQRNKEALIRNCMRGRGYNVVG
jgi:hypothetical protein